MIRHKIIFLLLLLCATYSTAEEEAKEAEDRTDAKTALQKSQPYQQQEPSFFTKIASWLFPFGSGESDNVPAEGHYAPLQYLPPPQAFALPEKDCNPCNQEPWIPMASNVGHQTVINFVPPSSSHEISSLESLHPPIENYQLPPNQYGPPPKFRPKFPGKPYGIPKPQNHYGPPSSETTIHDYIVPPPLNFRPPQFNYRPNNKYGPPTKTYGPPKPVYGPPRPQYGPPRPPKPQYGPPQQFIPPQNVPTTHLKPISGSYGAPPDIRPPPISGEYGAPPDIRQPPISGEYGAPNVNYGVPGTVPSVNVNAPLPNPIPSDSYGAPLQGPAVDYFKNEQLTSSTGDNEHLNRPIPFPNLSLVPIAPLREASNFKQVYHQGSSGNVQIVPSVKVADYLSSIEHPINVIQSPIVEVNVKDTSPFEKPPEDINQPLPPLNPPQSIEQSDLQQYGQPQSIEQSDLQQYGQPQSIEQQYGQPQQPQSIEQSDLQQYREPQPSGVGNILNSIGQNGQIDFEQKGRSEFQLHQQDSSIYSSQSVNKETVVNPEFKLSENPIVVEDTHTAASNVNTTTYTNQTKRDNAKNALKNEQEVRAGAQDLNEVNTDFIKKLLLEQGILGNPQTELLDIKKVNDPRFNINPHSELLNVKKANNTTFLTPPPMDYSQWIPTYQNQPQNPLTSMRPPLPQPTGKSTWLRPVELATTTKRPKQIQIIVPYITNKKPVPFEKQQFFNKGTQGVKVYPKGYTTLVPVYTPPPSTQESIWSKFVDDFNIAESKKVIATAFSKPQTTPVYNIRDLINAGRTEHPINTSNLPYDVISLQKTIDQWTQQEYSNKINNNQQKVAEKIVTSKNIPKGFLTSQQNEVTTIRNDNITTFEDIFKNIESNFVLTDGLASSTETSTTAKNSTVLKPVAESFTQKSSWDLGVVTVSPLTKEKVYVVTPQSYRYDSSTPATAWSMAPKIENGKVNNDTNLAFASARFSVRVEPENKVSRDLLQQDTKNSVKVVYSEWPHLINNLQTTTTPKPTSRHPLFGLMDIPAYTPPPNSTVQTISGHSKVVTVVTPSSVSKKKTTDPEKKSTQKTTTVKY